MTITAAAHHDRRTLRAKASVAEITRPARPTHAQLAWLSEQAARDVHAETVAATGINPDGTECTWCGEFTYQAADDHGRAYCDDTCADGHVDSWLATAPPPGWVPDLTSDDLDRAEATR